MNASPTPAQSPSRLRTLGWAAYLACSWTWCIGMFLPVLLIRDFGIWGFVVFAVPNVIGAAAMGWVLTRSSSDQLEHRHRHACTAFSLVTIAFHVFFVAQPVIWLAQCIHVDVRLFLPVVVLVMAQIAMVDGAGGGALLTLLVSLICIGCFASRGNIRFEEALVHSGPLTTQTPALAAVCIFGFALCPYLDLTFHRGLRESAGGTARDEAARRRAAFSIGFGIMFFAMILFTLWYSQLFGPRYLQPLAVIAMCLHMLCQIGFTVGVHAREAIRRSSSGWIRAATWCGLAALIVVPILQFLSAGTTDSRVELTFVAQNGETIYRLFMSAYGLLFPAYVYLCMIPTRDGHSGPRRDKLLVWLFACGVAAPMFWMGFIERQTWWLVPGVGVVLLARLALRRSVASSLRRSPPPTLLPS